MRTALRPYVAKTTKEFSVTFPETTPVLVDASHDSPSYDRQAHLLQVVCIGVQKSRERRAIPAVTETMVASASSDLSDLSPFNAHAL